ncbi:MAG: gliding motility protein GldC [Chitinophagales bacterium]|nr:MAG: gliding motility protein GldC [Chitinophagales bacterium]
MSVNQSEIKIHVALNEKKLPVSLSWSAEEVGEKEKPCEALMLSLWDTQEKNTLRIDLWTQNMRKDEMTDFFFQSLVSSAETYERATGIRGIAEATKQFCRQLSETITQQVQSSADTEGMQ